MYSQALFYLPSSVPRIPALPTGRWINPIICYSVFEQALTECLGSAAANRYLGFIPRPIASISAKHI